MKFRAVFFGVTVLCIIAIMGVEPADSTERQDDSDGFINIRINQDATQELQNEMQVAINPTDSENIVAVWRDFRKGYRQVGYGWSKDGGLTWTEGLFIDPYYPWDSDPGITVDRFGNFYAVVLAYVSTWEENALFVYKSTDGGENWDGPFTVVDGYPGVFEDKELIACDRSGGIHDGNLYVAWARFGWNIDIYCARSTNGGASFETAVRVSDSPSVQWPVPAVGPGGELYVAWDSYSYPYRIKLDRSFDGGVSFGSDITVRTVSFPPGGSINGGITVFPFPAMDVDMDTGHLYIAYMDEGYNSTDIFLTKSTNGGSTWSSPVRVNDDPENNGCDQFHPWLSIDEEGIITIIFLDRRNDPANYMMDCYMTWSTDGGATFSKNIRLSTVSSDPQAGSDRDGSGLAQGERLRPLSSSRAGLLGEYIGLSTRYGKKAAPVWTDTRNGHQDAYYAIPDSTRFFAAFDSDTPSAPPGGTLTTEYEIAHAGDSPLTPQGWINAYLPNGNEYSGNPFQGPIDVSFDPGQTRAGNLSFKVPGVAPPGTGYRLELCIGYWPYFVLAAGSFEFEITPGSD